MEEEEKRTKKERPKTGKDSQEQRLQESSCVTHLAHIKVQNWCKNHTDDQLSAVQTSGFGKRGCGG
jgi:hypothetical protein